MQHLWNSTVAVLPTVKSADAADAELSYHIFCQLCRLDALRPAAAFYLISAFLGDPRCC
jgi:hypothetical protein